ncbi:hypothetical protein H4Q32_012741 [Labeo rohita]|uniref:Uncharacterized protein n=1 Tax=Labeo rohita TaxID=84645 RepID=A0ABQ8M155_LABRO|nr:hypothetical protein H4Q32_012741 [Labeo rohita]
MSRPFQDSLFEVGLISTKFSPVAYPCCLASSRRSRRLRLPPSGKDVVFNHMARLGFQAIWEKSKLSSAQGFFFICVKLDSRHYGFTSFLRLCIVSAEVRESTQIQYSCPLDIFQRLLGHMASSATVMLLGLMHIKPL